MTAAPDDKILERIKKLHAKAVSAKEIGSEAEALIFMDAVQKMLAKYEMDISEVDYQLQLKTDQVKALFLHPDQIGVKNQSTSDPLHWLLMASLCKLFHCAHLGDKTTPRGGWIIGRREHREIAAFMIATMIRTMEDLSQKAYVKEFHRCRRMGDVSQARGYKESFRQGFASGVAGKVQQLLVDREVQAKQSGTGLVRLDTEKRLVQEFLEKTPTEKKAVTKPRELRHAGGFNAGKKAGDAVNLAPNIVRPAAGQKRIGPGQ